MRPETAGLRASDIIRERQIEEILTNNRKRDASLVREILARARELKGLPMEDVAVLAEISDPELLAELFATARQVKQNI